MLPFSHEVWSLLINRLNIANGIFTTYRIFLVMEERRLELKFVEGTQLRLEEALDEDVRRKTSEKPRPLIEASFHEFTVVKDYLAVTGTKFGPIRGMITMQLLGAGRTVRTKDRLA